MTFVPGVARPPSPPAERTYFVVNRRGLVVRRDEGAVRILGDADIEALGLGGAEVHHLGLLDGREALAVALGGEAPPPFEALGLRALHGAVSDEVWGVAGRATQIVEWADTHRFCGRCGTPTARVDGERAMRCPSCTLSAYPRIAPAIIVLVRKGNLALLARGSRFPLPFYSTLAGFSEPGESLEETLVREVKEEVSVDVGDARYFGSQSWPFPHSLMVGFFATWKGGDIVADPAEIADAGWFRHDELPMIPPPLSMARQLIDAWVADVTRR